MDDLTITPGSLDGECVGFTGQFQTFSRANTRVIVTRAGGTPVARPNGQTILVVGTGETVSERKIQQAQKRGIRLMTEVEFCDRLALIR